MRRAWLNWLKFTLKTSHARKTLNFVCRFSQKLTKAWTLWQWKSIRRLPFTAATYHRLSFLAGLSRRNRNNFKWNPDIVLREKNMKKLNNHDIWTPTKKREWGELLNNPITLWCKEKQSLCSVASLFWSQSLKCAYCLSIDINIIKIYRRC